MSAIASGDVGGCRAAFTKRGTWFGLLFLVLWTLIVAGCGGDDSTTPPPPNTTTGSTDGGNRDGAGGGNVGMDVRVDVPVTPPEAGPPEAGPPDVAPPGMDAGMDAPPLVALATPTFSPVSDGGSFPGSVDVTISVAGLPAGGTIYYTNNG